MVRYVYLLSLGLLSVGSVMGADTAPLLASQRDGASAAADITSLGRVFI